MNKRSDCTLKTEIVFILDSSGSMNSLKSDAIGGFNTFLEDQQSVKGDANLTLVLFSTWSRNIYTSKDIREVEPLTDSIYKPSGGTALLDAIGDSIQALLDKEENPDQVIVAIMTDGEENSSKKYSKAEVSRMVKLLEKFGKFTFLFLGANQDAFTEAGDIGISINNTANFGFDAGGFNASYSALSKATTMYRSGATMDSFNLQAEVKNNSK
jgi:Mg-chelatase subunit ChlD